MPKKSPGQVDCVTRKHSDTRNGTCPLIHPNYLFFGHDIRFCHWINPNRTV